MCQPAALTGWEKDKLPLTLLPLLQLLLTACSHILSLLCYTLHGDLLWDSRGARFLLGHFRVQWSAGDSLFCALSAVRR